MDNTFFDIHIEIINAIKQKVKKGKKKVTKKSVLYRYENHDTSIIRIYASDDVFTIEAESGWISHGGIYTGVLNDKYICKADTLKWRNDDWEKYKQKTIDYLTALIFFAAELELCFEHYDCLYDYGKICQDFLSENAEKWYINWFDRNVEHDFQDKTLYTNYALNLITTYPAEYKKKHSLNRYVKFLKQITELIPTAFNAEVTVWDIEEKYKKLTFEEKKVSAEKMIPKTLAKTFHQYFC